MVQAQNMLLGVGDIYVKRSSDADSKWRLVGAVKGTCEFNYKPTFVKQRPSNMTTFPRKDRIEEVATMKLTLADFRMDQMIAALGKSISTTQLTLTSSIRVQQELTTKASTTTSQTLSHSAKSLTSVAFTSLDRATDYVSATDFTMIANNKFKAKSATFKGGKVVRAYYTRRISACKRINMGNDSVLQSMSLMFVHKMSNGKHISIQFPIAVLEGDYKLDFKEKDYTTPEITFEALGDPTLPRGKQLFSIIKEE